MDRMLPAKHAGGQATPKGLFGSFWPSKKNRRPRRALGGLLKPNGFKPGSSLKKKAMKKIPSKEVFLTTLTRTRGKAMMTALSPATGGLPCRVPS
ncbi:hypothetical protein [Pseudodesulfovibrio sp.]|uniref:hypothetical protein n=1 Tax=unclassified Pseudodesulfovibrio TaxID=2661612 RepID=UPI003B00DD21